jgi:NAD(P)-dependent dehydrogenase (short-subunit alcohol dehydrogenase family)
MSTQTFKDYSTSLPPSLSLTGKSAIITGSSRGIGSAIALTLASRGANIALTYTSDSSTIKAEEIASQIRALGRKVCIIQCDLEREDCGEAIVREALEGLETKTIEILVNNAAIAPPATSVSDGSKIEDFDRYVFLSNRIILELKD